MGIEEHIEVLSSQYIDLAAERFGGIVLYATDDFFAEKENLIKPGRGVFVPDRYTDRGKWMDGWESRRKRGPGNDWAIIKLGAPGNIHGFDIDTNHFLGNHPPFASVEGIALRDGDEVEQWDKLPWREILPKSALNAGTQNAFDCTEHSVYTHLRLHIYPDGGVARFRVYGNVHKDWKAIKRGAQLDLAAAVNGARALACSDMFFSKMSNLIMPGRGINMGDGWETKRSRVDGHFDWVIIKLATAGRIHEILVDTAHFKGNYPDCCLIEGCYSTDDSTVLEQNATWFPLIEQEKLVAHEEQKFASLSVAPVSHVRLTIYPDGGVSRLRLFGNIHQA